MQKAVRERQSTPPGPGGRSIVTQMNKQVKISRRRRDSVGFCRVTGAFCWARHASSWGPSVVPTHTVHVVFTS